VQHHRAWSVTGWQKGLTSRLSPWARSCGAGRGLAAHESARSRRDVDFHCRPVAKPVSLNPRVYRAAWSIEDVAAQIDAIRIPTRPLFLGVPNGHVDPYSLQLQNGQPGCIMSGSSATRLNNARPPDILDCLLRFCREWIVRSGGFSIGFSRRCRRCRRPFVVVCRALCLASDLHEQGRRPRCTICSTTLRD